MKKSLLIALATLMISFAASAQTMVERPYDESIDQNEQIDQAVAKAKAQGKFVIAQVGGNWCPWCLKFAAYIKANEAIAKLVEDNFIYIHVDYTPKSFKTDEARKQRTLKAMERLGKANRFGFPVMVVLDENGKVIHIQDSSYLEEGDGYNEKKVSSFFKHWTPKAVKG